MPSLFLKYPNCGISKNLIRGTSGNRLHWTCSAPHHIGTNPALNDRFARLDLPAILFIGLDHTVNNNFFANMDLVLLLSGQGRTNTRDFIVCERALGLTAFHSQFVKLCDEILSLNPQLFSQQMNSCAHHELLPASTA